MFYQHFLTNVTNQTSSFVKKAIKKYLCKMMNIPECVISTSLMTFSKIKKLHNN